MYDKYRYIFIQNTIDYNIHEFMTLTINLKYNYNFKTLYLFLN